MNTYTIESKGVIKGLVDLDSIESITPHPEAGRPFIEIRYKGQDQVVHVDVDREEINEIMKSLNEAINSLPKN